MSKAITDLAGIGRLIGECRKFVMDLLRHRAGREERALKNTELALKNDSLSLKNQAVELKNNEAALRFVQQVFSTAKKQGWSAEETQELITRLTSRKQISPAKSETDIRSDVNPKLLGE